MSNDLKQGLALGVVFASLVAMMPTKAQAQEWEDREIGERCIPSVAVERVDVQDRQTINFVMRDGSVYQNRLTGSLRNSFGNDPLVFDRTHRSAQYCKMDGVGVMDRITRPTYPFPNQSLMFTASLGRFVKVIERI